MPNKPGRPLPSAAIGLLLLIGLTLLIYLPGLQGPLIFDDYVNLEPLQNLETGLVSVGEALRSSPHGADRPVSMLSFIANWKMTGNDIGYLKLTNIMIHLACGVLIFLLGVLLLAKRFRDAATVNYAALFITALWLLSPMQVSTVLYVVQRMAQLSALFLLAALLCYVIGRNKINAAETGPGWSLITIALLVFWPLSFFSKQNGAVLPLILLLLELFFYGNALSTNKFRLLSGLLIALPAIYIGHKFYNDPGWLTAAYDKREFSPGERLLTQSRILFDYAANLLLLPGGSPMGLFHDDYLKSTGLLSPPATLISILSLAGIVIVSLRYRRFAVGTVLFGVLFFLVGHAVESTFLPLELYFEHRNYLPAFGLYFSLGAGGGLLLLQGNYKTLIFAVMLIMSLWFMVITGHRVTIWQSTGSILHASVSVHPDSWRTHTRLANLSMLNGEVEIANRHLAEATRIDHDKGQYGVRLSRLITYCFSGDTPAPELYEKLETTVLSDDAYSLSIIRWYAELLETGECEHLERQRIVTAVATSLKNRNVSDDGELWGLHLYTGKLYARLGETENALFHYLESYRLNNRYHDTAILALELQLAAGDYRAAVELLNRIDRAGSYKYQYQRVKFNEYKRLLIDKYQRNR